MATEPTFDLYLFSTHEETVKSALQAGVKGIGINWEHIGKSSTEGTVTHDSIDDLTKIRAITSAPILCIINRFSPGTEREVEEAIKGGATEILLPMVTESSQIEKTLQWANGRVGVGIVIETQAALRSARQLARYPLSRVFIGLKDLAEENRRTGKNTHIYEPIVDGTIERVRSGFKMPVGFGELTLPECGTPIPSRLLMSEMARLQCSYGVLKQAFLQDIKDKSMADEVPRIIRAIQDTFAYSQTVFGLNRRALTGMLSQK